MQVKYRSFTPGLNPRRTKLEVPGWGGERQPRQDGSMEQAWHCLPFSEGARYGIELFYPYENELRVSVSEGKLALEGDFGPPPEEQGGEWPPFRPFGDLYYTYQLSLDLKVDEGWAVRTEPHPRFYTDPTDTTPIAVPALIRRWWPMIFFLVFKSPPEGKDPYFSARRAVRANPDRSRGSDVRACAHARRGSSRARVAVPPHLPEPRHFIRRDPMDLGDKHGFRRHLSTYSRRSERKSEAAPLTGAAFSTPPWVDERRSCCGCPCDLSSNRGDDGGSGGDDGSDGDSNDGGDGGGNSDDDDGDGDTEPFPSALLYRQRRCCRARPQPARPSRRSEWGLTTLQTSGPVATGQIPRLRARRRPARRPGGPRLRRRSVG